MAPLLEDHLQAALQWAGTVVPQVVVLPVEDLVLPLVEPPPRVDLLCLLLSQAFSSFL